MTPRKPAALLLLATLAAGVVLGVRSADWLARFRWVDETDDFGSFAPEDARVGVPSAP